MASVTEGEDDETAADAAMEAAASVVGGVGAFDVTSSDELLFFLIHLLISGPLRSYKSLRPPQPTECTVLIFCTASITTASPNNSL